MHFFIVNLHRQVAFETGFKNDIFFSSREAKTRKNVPPAGRLQRGPPDAPPSPPSPHPGGCRGRGLAATTSALLGGSSVLAYYAVGVHTAVLSTRAVRVQPYRFGGGGVSPCCARLVEALLSVFSLFCFFFPIVCGRVPSFQLSDGYFSLCRSLWPHATTTEITRGRCSPFRTKGQSIRTVAVLRASGCAGCGAGCRWARTRKPMVKCEQQPN